MNKKIGNILQGAHYVLGTMVTALFDYDLILQSP